MRDKALQALDIAAGYTKDKPIKGMLMAAAAGALIMGLVTLMSRPRD